MPRPKKIAQVIDLYPTWVGKQGAMKILDCGEDFLDNLRNKAELPFAQDGKKIWYEVKGILRYIERHRIV